MIDRDPFLEEHCRFQRRGADLFLNMDISLVEAGSIKGFTSNFTQTVYLTSRNSHQFSPQIGALCGGGVFVAAAAAAAAATATASVVAAVVVAAAVVVQQQFVFQQKVNSQNTRISTNLALPISSSKIPISKFMTGRICRRRWWASAA